MCARSSDLTNCRLIQAFPVPCRERCAYQKHCPIAGAAAVCEQGYNYGIEYSTLLSSPIPVVQTPHAYDHSIHKIHKYKNANGSIISTITIKYSMVLTIYFSTTSPYIIIGLLDFGTSSARKGFRVAPIFIF